jgi:NADH-quinone oxidoreductase subunit G
VEWQVALDFVARELKRIRDRHGASSIGALATPHQTLEELFLLGKLARDLASGNVDFRLRQSDFGADARRAGAPWLGMKIAEINALDRALVIGATLRKDHPLITHRLRQAARRQLQLSLIHSVDDDLLLRLTHKAIVAPAAMPGTLAQAAKAVAESKGISLPQPVSDWAGGVVVSDAVRGIAGSLIAGKNSAIFLGNLAQHHPQAAQLHVLAQALADLTGARMGFLGEAANSVGGYLAGCVPTGAPPGRNARQMFEEPLKAYLLLGVEAELDTHDPQRAMAALGAAELVVAMSPYEHRATEYAHVLLPIAPFTETAGTFVNTEGTAQSFEGVVRPLGDARPAWKVLRVLGNLLGLDGFEYDSVEEVRQEALRGKRIESLLDNRLKDARIPTAAAPQASGIQRIAEVPIYAADAIVRRSRALQLTRDAAAPVAWMNRALFEQLGMREGDTLRVRQGAGEALVDAAVDDGLPAGCIRLAAARRETAALGAMFGTVTAERVPAQRRAAV